MALENRLLARSNETGISLDRLRRRVVFERVVARLQAAEPGRWVIKGGMALEMRLGSPTAIPPLPDSWPIRYEQLATDHDLQTLSFADAVALINRLWAATQRSSSG
jgi:hypothetical protein